MRKYEKTIDVKTAIESMLALFVVEKMSRSSVRDWPQLRFYPRKAYLYITDIETKLGSEFQKLLHVFIPFLSNIDFSIIAKIICNRKDHLMAIM